MEERELERRMNMRKAHLVRRRPKDYQHGLMQTKGYETDRRMKIRRPYLLREDLKIINMVNGNKKKERGLNEVEEEKRAYL